MSHKLKCGCVIADIKDASVRKGYELGGYVKQFCPEHGKPDLPTKEETSDIQEQVTEMIERHWDETSDDIAQQIDQLYRKEYRERLVGAYDEYLHKCGIMRVLPDQNRVRELIKQELSDD